MALSIDSQESGGVAHHSATSPLSWSFNNVAGTLLVVGIVLTNSSGSPSISGVTYGGTPMNPVTGTVNWDGVFNVAALYWLANPKTGSNTVQVTATVQIDILAAAISFTAANLDAPVGSAVTNFDNSGTSGTASVSVPNTKSGSYVVSAVGTGSGVSSANSPTVLSALLNESTISGGDNFALGQQATSGGTVTAGYSVSPDLWGLAAVEVFAFDPALDAAIYGVTPTPRFEPVAVDCY